MLLDPGSYRALALATVLAGLAPAQMVHNVGPGGFAQIQQAITAAAAGDVIVVATGSYDTFRLDKALTITAAAGATVDVVSTASSGGVVQCVIPAGGTARVSGLRFRSPVPFWFGLKVAVQQGTVWFEDCLIEQGSHVQGAALEVRVSAAVLRRCTVTGSGGPNNQIPGGGAAGGTALLADRAWVSATECTFLGGDLHYDLGGHGGHGVEITGATVHLVRCTATGGQNSTVLNQCAFYPAGHGVMVNSAFAVWLSDCTLAGGRGNCGVAGDGLHNASQQPVQLARTTAVGGIGATAGVPFFGPVQPAPLLGLGNDPGPVLLGATWQVNWLAAPGTPIAAVLSVELAPHGDPLLVQRSWLPGANVFLAGLLAADPLGVAAFAVFVPAVPALRHQTFWLHGYAGLSPPLQGTPPLGGVAR